MKDTIVTVGDNKVKLTNLNKEFWPGEGLTKAHLIKYYTEMAPFILPFIKNRPLVMKRYPDGIRGHFFYQKECPSYAPDWVESFAVKHSRKIINYIICNDSATLMWLANQGCIEVHTWLSSLDNLDFPDIAVMDLDPAEGTEFTAVVKISMLIREALLFFDLRSFIKTSGASGLHIFIPIKPKYTFNEVTEFMKYIAEKVVKIYPHKATIERTVNKRHGKVYLDYLQNGRGKTMAFPYSLRPFSGAPISTPLNWDEVSSLVSSRIFNIRTIKQRVSLNGDCWEQMLYCKQSLDKLAEAVTSQQKPGRFKEFKENIPIEAH